MMLTPKEAAQINGVTNQAIHMAIKAKKLVAIQNEKSKRWNINSKDLYEYKENKYKRKFKDGMLSIPEAAKYINLSEIRIRQLIKTKTIRCERIKWQWRIDPISLEEYKKFREENIIGEKCELLGANCHC
jgi:excisionase family DNA binding protein